MSAATSTSPFLWAFFTRPEPHIISAFSSNRALDICWHLTLPVESPDSDKDIRTFLRDGFRMMRAKHSLHPSWPSVADFDCLAKQSKGLFAYSTNAIRFIDEGPGLPRLGPEDHLQMLLEAREGPRAKLSKLDQLYLLIMDQIPKKTLPTTLLVLCANQHLVATQRSIILLSCLLGFSQSALLIALNTLHSVLEVTGTGNWQGYPCLRYHHASFTDFLTTLERSTSEYCIHTQGAFNQLYSACIDAACRPLPPIHTSHQFPEVHLNTDLEKMVAVYNVSISTLLVLPGVMSRLQIHNRPDPMKLKDVDWSFAVICCREDGFLPFHIESFVEHIPRKWRSVIIHPYSRETFLAKVKRKVFNRGLKRDVDYILGRGTNRVRLVFDGKYYRFKSNPQK